MSLSHVKGDIKKVAGKRVTHCLAYVDGEGYGQIVMLFDDNSRLIVSEEGQVGKLGVVYDELP